MGWYQEFPEASAKMLAKCGISKNNPILDMGAGATVFIDYLIEEGFEDITAVDISEIGLDKLKNRLGEEKASKVKWIVDDVTNSTHVQNLNDVALWHDRAVLHFLLEEEDRDSYLSNLKKLVRKGGYVIISAFHLKGAEICSGLKVRRYDQNMLADFLGEDFELLEYFDYMHHMPSGDPRPFIYTLFRRK
jgi:SAM-dependent methyltransferase